MRTIVIGDIHGCYDELIELMDYIKETWNYDSKVDRLIFLGDYIDRGKDSRLVVSYIRQLQSESDNVIALMGNHEDMFIDLIDSNDYLSIHNGGYNTLESYKGYDEQLISDLNWMRKLPLYFEDDHHIYVHAGIDMTENNMRKQKRSTLLWVREPFIWDYHEYRKQVVFGHTPFLSKDGKPAYTIGNNISLDTGCVFGGYLTALLIEDGVAKSFCQVEKKEEKKEEKQKKENKVKPRKKSQKAKKKVIGTEDLYGYNDSDCNSWDTYTTYAHDDYEYFARGEEWYE